VEKERGCMEKVKAKGKRRGQRKHFPQNEELWREVALIMTDLARLEKEKTMRINAGSILDKMDDESEKYQRNGYCST